MPRRLKPSPPNVFIGDPVLDSPVVSSVEPPLKSCGNDELRQTTYLQISSQNSDTPFLAAAFFLIDKRVADCAAKREIG